MIPKKYHARNRKTSRRRNGYLYVAVLFTTLIIVAVVTASLSLSSANARAEVDRGNQTSALRLAESEIHRMAAQMQSSSDWRVRETNDTYTSWQDLSPSGVVNSDAGQVRHRFLDRDGDLADDLEDTVTLTAHALVGRSNVGVSVDMVPRYDPLSILNYGVTATDDIQFENGGTLSVENNVQVGDDCKTTSSGVLITQQLECSGSVQMILRGDLANDNIEVPSHNVVDYYFQNGTTIPLLLLPVVGGIRVIENQLVSPSVNPYGTANSSGIYRIDARGQNLRITNCRIDATLVIHDAPLIEIGGGMNWSFPAGADAFLVTDGTVQFLNVEPTLSESTAGMNFNPASSPYRGSSNNLTNDTYPTEMRGILYSTQDVFFSSSTDSSHLMITGALICRDLEVRMNVAVRQLNELVESPPTAFADWVPMEFVHGSMRRVAVQ